jgi:hypothetical protein
MLLEASKHQITDVLVLLWSCVPGPLQCLHSTALQNTPSAHPRRRRHARHLMSHASLLSQSGHARLDIGVDIGILEIDIDASRR